MLNTVFLVLDQGAKWRVLTLVRFCCRNAVVLSNQTLKIALVEVFFYPIKPSRKDGVLRLTAV